MAERRFQMSVRWGALLLLPPAALVWVGTALNKTLNADESQHLHAAWLVAGGAVPFADFWEHHMPLLYYGLAPLTRWVGEGPAIYLVARALMVATAALALGLVAGLGRRLSAGAALGAVAALAFQPRFVEHASEVRADVPALVAWLAAVLALVRWREDGAPAWLWRAGLLLGVALSLTLKTLYAAPGVALAIALAERAAGPGAARRTLAAWARVAAGAAAPVLALLLGLALHGGRRAIEGFAEHVVAWTLVFADFTKEGPVTDEGLGYLALAVVGVALVVRAHGRATLVHPLHGPLLCPAAATALVLLLPTTPAVYRHAWLPVMAVAGVYVGHALAGAVGAARTRRPAAVVLAAVAVAAGLLGPASVSLATALADGNSRQFRLMRLELAHTCPGEPVLDGTALYVFRPAAHRYRVLIVGVREWIATGVVAEDLLVDDVRASRPRVAYVDSRLRGLVGPMAEFIARHYVRSADGLLIAGAAVRLAPPREAGRAYVELLHGETYRLAASPGVEVAIDRQPARPGLVRLAAGRHEVTWRGPVGAIELTTLPCAERASVLP
jgi:hypothetical protein